MPVNRHYRAAQTAAVQPVNNAVQAVEDHLPAVAVGESAARLVRDSYASNTRRCYAGQLRLLDGWLSERGESLATLDDGLLADWTARPRVALSRLSEPPSTWLVAPVPSPVRPRSSAPSMSERTPSSARRLAASCRRLKDSHLPISSSPAAAAEAERGQAGGPRAPLPSTRRHHAAATLAQQSAAPVALCAPALPRIASGVGVGLRVLRAGELLLPPRVVGDEDLEEQAGRWLDRRNGQRAASRRGRHRHFAAVDDPLAAPRERLHGFGQSVYGLSATSHATGRVRGLAAVIVVM